MKTEARIKVTKEALPIVAVLEQLQDNEFLDNLSEKMTEAGEACGVKSPSTVTVKFTLLGGDRGAVSIRADIDTKTPKAASDSRQFFLVPGGFSRKSPKQLAMSLGDSDDE